MSNDHCDATSAAHIQHGFAQSLLPLGIQVGIGLVEHHEERLIIECPGQADTLALSSR